MTDVVTVHYSTGTARERIEAALRSAGLDLDALRPDDLAPVEDFHTLGRLATVALVERAGVSPADRVLDAGAGIGGTSRYVAATVGARVTAVDLTAEFCDTARWLTGLVGLGERVEIRQADLLDLPFAAGSFDVALSQHVQMNIGDKAAFFRELHRVLAPGGRLALWEVASGANQPLAFPVPWADDAAASHLVTPAELRAAAEAEGFTVRAWEDQTEPAAAVMEGFLAEPASPLGLQAFVPGFAAKARNLVDNLAQNRARLIQAVLVSG